MTGNDVNSTLEALGGLIDTSSLKEDLSKIEPQQPAQPPATPQVNATPPVTPPTIETPAPAAPDTPQTPPANITAEEGGQSPPATADQVDQGVEIDTPMGKINLGGKQKPADLKFEDMNQVSDYVKKNFGVEDAGKFLSELVPNWRKEAQAKADFEKKVKQFEDVFSKMPEELYEAISAWGNGKDYKQVINSRPNLDFSIDVEKHDKKTLVETYFPGQFTQDDWDEYKDPKGDKNVKKAIDAFMAQASAKFDLDKNKFKNTRAQLESDAREKQKARTESIESSVRNLTNSLPGVSEAFVKDVSDSLTSGKWTELFIDPKTGAFLPDAAQRIAMAQHGREMMQQIISNNVKEAVNKERQGIIDRTPEGSGNASSGGAGQDPIKSLENKLAAVIPAGHKNVY